MHGHGRVEHCRKGEPFFPIGVLLNSSLSANPASLSTTGSTQTTTVTLTNQKTPWASAVTSVTISCTGDLCAYTTVKPEGTESFLPLSTPLPLGDIPLSDLDKTVDIKLALTALDTSQTRTGTLLISSTNTPPLSIPASITYACIGAGQECSTGTCCSGKTCVSSPAQDSTRCCNTGQCWDGTSCIPNGALRSALEKYCNNGVWSDYCTLQTGALLAHCEDGAQNCQESVLDGGPACGESCECKDGFKNCQEVCDQDTDCAVPPTLTNPSAETLTYYTATCNPTCSECITTQQTGDYCATIEHCGDGVCNCQEDTSCPDCLAQLGSSCSTDTECAQGTCKPSPTGTSKACCDAGCWTGTSCITTGTDASKSYVCASTGWTQCTSLQEGQQEQGLTCASGQWRSPGSLFSSCYNQDSLCAQGTCCSTSTCGYAEGESCSLSTQCCAGTCTNNHCCPASTVWCGSSCTTVKALGDACECNNECPAGSTCAGTCTTATPCSGPDTCASPLECAKDTEGAYASCCSEGSCWDEASGSCISHEQENEDNSLICLQGAWTSNCAPNGAGTYGDYLGKCKSACPGTDPVCDQTAPGTDPCTTSCTQAPQLNLTLEAYPCTATTVAECIASLGQPALEIPAGAHCLIKFDTTMPAGEEKDILLTLVVDDVEVHAENSTGSLTLLQDLPAGTRKITLIASDPDFLDERKTLDLAVVPDARSAVQASIQPDKVALNPGTTTSLELLLNNTYDVPYAFNTSYTLNTTLPGQVSLNRTEYKRVVFNLTAPAEEGFHELNLTLASDFGMLTASSEVLVVIGNLRSVRMRRVLQAGQTQVVILNNGTLDTIYEIETCATVAENVTLSPGESHQISLGALTEPCEVCATYDEKKECATYRPASLTITLPSKVNATANQAGTLLFKTTASSPGTIHVTPSLWIGAFDCPATCERELEFVPDGTGTFTLEFGVAWAQEGISTKSSTQVVVGTGWDSAKDAQSVTTKTASLKKQLSDLESQGIQSPAVKKILDAVSKASLSSLEDVAKAQGQLLQAEKFLKEAAQTKVGTAGEFPLASLVIGIVSILFAAGILVVVFHHGNLPAKPLERNLPMGARQYYPAQQYQGMTRPSAPPAQPPVQPPSQP